KVCNWFTHPGLLPPEMIDLALLLNTARSLVLIGEVGVESRKTMLGRLGAIPRKSRTYGGTGLFVRGSMASASTNSYSSSEIRSSAVAATRFTAPSMAVPVRPVTPDLSSTASTTHGRDGRAAS